MFHCQHTAIVMSHFSQGVFICTCPNSQQVLKRGKNIDSKNREFVKKTKKIIF